MATAVLSNRRPATSAGIPSNLPVIEHPRSRLGDKNTLNIRGSNRGDLITPLGRCSPFGDETIAGADSPVNGPNSNLPPLRKGEGVPIFGREKENRQLGESLDSGVARGSGRRKHTRMLTWPPVHEQQPGEKRALSARVQGVDGTPRRKYVPEDLYEIIREKLTTGYHGLHQLFRANDPQGNSTVSKVALTRILYHLVGYLTREEVQKLLTRLGLDGMETVSFDNFIACFRDNETVKREWLSPVARKEFSAEQRKNNLEDHLCFKRPAPEMVTATYANALLKEKCRHSDFDLRRHLAPSCFDPGAVILPPQMEECLASIGVRLDDYEMQKLWERYDLENTGAVNSAWFFIQIGLDSRGHHLVRAKTAPPRVRNQPRTPWVPRIPEETQELIEEPENVEPPMERPPTDVPRPPSVDIISFLLRRMEQNYHGFLMGFEHFDYNNDGTVSRAHFRDMLLEYDLPMLPVEIEHLLERVGLRRKDGRVSYRDFLHKFMSRMDNGIAHRIIMDGKHRFNTRAQTPHGPLTAQDAEAKLVEMFHKDFLRLLATLKSQDQYSLKLITQKQFRDSVDRVFGIRMSDLQLDQLLIEIGVNLDDLVPYPEFLAIFNRKRPSVALRSQTPRPQSQQQVERSAPAPRIATPEEYIVPPNLAGPVEFGDSQRQSQGEAAGGGATKRKGMETRYRPVKEMEDTIEELLRRRGYEAQEAYHKIDRKATGRLSKTQLHQWLQELGFSLHPTELQTLWTALDIARDGLVHYAELFDYFISRSRRRVAVVTKTHQASSQRKGPIMRESQSQPQVRRRQSNEAGAPSRDLFGTPAEDIVARIRPQVLQSWDELKMSLREMDPYGVAMVPIPQFHALLQQVNINLSPSQLERLCSRFDFSQNGQFHYLQFLQLFVEPSSRKPSKTGIRVTDQNEKGGGQMTVSSAMIKIRKQLLHDWKSLRRAFKKADLNHDGSLSVPEFRRILGESKIRFNEEDFYHIVSELDKNLDGRISYDEFISSMMSI
ncbi:EF-hand calcium-binding domain-containing protein 6-like [Patiria miniata]|uniref:EF-hand domain-containing protein n=1 Tax=Patiria miniata TaxID=46514 RepID=A0A913ZE65_PATMI|nr:EF-hand calcium-binding domain-containing protein 6-like [Patiria miniata]